VIRSADSCGASGRQHAAGDEGRSWRDSRGGKRRRRSLDAFDKRHDQELYPDSLNVRIKVTHGLHHTLESKGARTQGVLWWTRRTFLSGPGLAAARWY
jgi:hypothetical protein